ncbi:MAG TPA: hypothetical protein VEI97_08225 [bacterium]|nr:hypothetical protein [bacterium]
MCYVAEFDGVFYATALWTRPINRSLPVKTWLELRRLAVAPDAPRNTASRMLAWMARDIARTRPEVVRLISYQDVERHTGGIYRAAGWVRGDQRAQAGKRWNHKTRSRNPDQSVSAKVRWEKHLRGD